MALKKYCMWNGKKEIYSDKLKTYYLGIYFIKSLLRTSFFSKIFGTLLYLNTYIRTVKYIYWIEIRQYIINRLSHNRSIYCATLTNSFFKNLFIGFFIILFIQYYKFYTNDFSFSTTILQKHWLYSLYCKQAIFTTI